MEHADLFFDILLVTGAAFAGGYLAHLLRLPTIIGFLTAGMAIGPNTPGPAGDIEQVRQAAELGVILLMFGLGIQVSFRDLIALRRIALLGGPAQVALTAALAFAAGPMLGLDWRGAVVLGFLVAISSTIVALKFLESRGELASVHGRAVVGICIFQDLAVVLMVLVLPSLGGEGFEAGRFFAALGKGAALVVVAYVLATRLVPRLWRYLAYVRSRELSLLASITLAVGLATGSALLGLSVAFGAFLAGVAVSESEYGFQTLAEILPLREIFATVFFVAVGMLIDPGILFDEPVLVAGVLVLAVMGKGLITAGVTRALGMSGAEALRTAVILVPVGEFSFVLARAGIDEGLISNDVGSAFLLGAVATIIVSPALITAVQRAVGLFRLVPGLEHLMVEWPRPVALDDRSVHRHVIIGGFGRTGRAIAEALGGRRLPFVVVDSNPFMLQEARLAGTPFIYGNISQPEVQELANIRSARILAITFPGDEARLAVLNAKMSNPRVDIVVSGAGTEVHETLRRLGASEVVDPNFEASLEFVRHVLHRFGVGAREIAALQAGRRAEHYRPAPPRPEEGPY